MSGVSTLSQQLSLINRIKTTQSEMMKYQLQVTSGLKHQSYKDYGSGALTIQRYRADLVNLDGYKKNIAITQTYLTQMNTATNEVLAQTNNVLKAMDIELAQGSNFNIQAIADVANSAFQLVEANMNVRIGDRYLFAGTDVEHKPYSNNFMLNASIQQITDDWLDGTINNTQYLSAINGLTDTQIGYNGTIQDAGRITARASEQFEVDYTVKANDVAFKKITLAMNALANLKQPDPDVDFATNEKFHELVTDLYSMLQSGVEDMRKNSVKIASAAETLNTINTNHTVDQQNLRQIMEDTEAADETEASIMLLKVRDQLEASYRVTSLTNQLSLVNFISF